MSLRPSRTLKSLSLWLALAIASAGFTALYFIGLGGRQIPNLGAQDLGKPFLAPTAAGFKAGRDFNVPDDERTANLREDARNKVRPVFDFAPSIAVEVQAEVRTAFAQMRDLQTRTPIGVRRAREESDLQRVAREARKVQPEFRVFSDDPDDFHALEQARFSTDVEHEVLGLIEAAYRAKLVSGRDEFSRVGAGGIAVRVIGEAAETALQPIAPGVLDLREATAEMDRTAAAAPAQPKRSALARAILRLAKRQLRANLTVNTAETDARRRAAADGVKPAFIAVKKGQRIIGDGELVTEAHLLVLNEYRAQQDQFELLQQKIGVGLIVALLIAAAWATFRKGFARFNPSVPDAYFMVVLALLLVGGLQVAVSIADALHDRYARLPVEMVQFAFPCVAGAMLVRVLVGSACAEFFALVFAVLAGMTLGNSLSFTIFTLVTSLVASDAAATVSRRAGLSRAGLRAGAIGVALLGAMSLANGKASWLDVGWMSAGAFFGAVVLAPLVVMALTPLAEATFGYASDLKLRAFANLNHPALKELVMQAPGTYHHSIVMGTLVDAAAEAIGLNPLVARSCAYYHDIGKGRNPAYFGENQKGENPHDKLAPHLSASIIIKQVADGQELARQYKLPKRVGEVISQHHGTRLVGYFANKARDEAAARGAGITFDDAAFRYAGPIPQSREAALVMIADSCEAESRTLREPTPEALSALVRDTIQAIFSEGQLNECELDLRELNLVAEAFSKALAHVYVARSPAPLGAGPPRPPDAPKSFTVLKGGDGRATS